MTCGIYKLSSPDGKCYVGASKNIELRAKHHHHAGKAHRASKGLQEAFDEHGQLELTILTICAPEHLQMYEQIAIDALKPEYNVQQVARSTARKPCIISPHRTCPECGAKFQATHGRQVFCSTEHKKAFEQVSRLRGQMAMPFILAWRQGKRGATDDSRYALNELSAMADRWAAEDKRVGRRSDVVVTNKRIGGWSAADMQEAA